MFVFILAPVPFVVSGACRLGLLDANSCGRVDSDSPSDCHYAVGQPSSY